MQYPKLRIRPRSTQTTTEFRGLERRPGAGIGRWIDERNLSSDRAPRMSVRRGKYGADLEGNAIEDRIIGMCGGDHAVVLDAAGWLHCNGNKLYLAGMDGVSYSWRTESVNGGFSVIPDKGNTGAVPDAQVQQALWDAWQGHYGSATLVYDPAGAPGTNRWHWTEEDSWISLPDLGLVAARIPKQGDSFRVIFDVSCLFGEKPQIVRMGAYAVIVPGWMWVNTVKLAAGETMTEGEDYGSCLGSATAGGTVTLTMCNIDGEPYSGVSVSASEPSVQAGYWLDTSGSSPALREWSVSQSMWINIASTYIKVETLQHNGLLDTIRKGDAVKLRAECDAGTDDEVVRILNSSHYLYDADIPLDGSGWILIAGILPSDTVSVTLTEALVAVREMPTLDFLVEAGNRIWGCRYSEQDGINEIYGSKLGDFKNWQVFQGLSTDSWTASRGTAAPFTGAVTLHGCPLFFREDSLEKVVPSAAGAHQIVTYSLDGVQEGSSGSLCVIDDKLYYKGRQGVYAYGGTLPVLISAQFGDWKFEKASAARHRRKYAVCMQRMGGGRGNTKEPERLVLIYDTDVGDWHVEDEPWDGIAITWEDRLFYVREGMLCGYDAYSGSQDVQWYAETDSVSIELPEHKWITYLRLRFQLELGAVCRVYISYDDGPWLRKGTLHGNRLHTQELGIWPKRCDHFRLRLEGCGGCELQSISYRMERSEGGH